MAIPQRCSRIFVALMLMFSLFAGTMPTAQAAEIPSGSLTKPTADEIVELISDTFTAAKAKSGRRSFYNRCSTMVNYTSVVLGLQNQVYSCNGNREYNLYESVSQTDTGYDILLYSAGDYSLTGALNAISENGTKDVYNIIIGWQSGSSYASRLYGHTCFIFAILDGYVYFYESYGLSIGGTYYPEGAPIVCTIAEFAGYYDRWARFEGAVHFSNAQLERIYADDKVPQITGIQASGLSDLGFTLTFQAKDNIAISDAYINVWPYGLTEESAVTFPVEVIDGNATLWVSTDAFDNFTGRYNVTCYAADPAGNTTSRVLEGGVDLYRAEAVSGTYRVTAEVVTTHNAPYETVNDARTRLRTLTLGDRVEVVGQLVNDLGEVWYQLEDGSWVREDFLTREIEWQDILDYILNLFGELLTTPT